MGGNGHGVCLVCVELLGGAVRAGEADVRHHAYLTDRVLLAEGR
jgi:hypothetical protein